MPDRLILEDNARERAFTPSAIELVQVQEGKDGKATGMVWEVTIIGANSPSDIVNFHGREFIASQNGRLYSCDALKQSASQWEGVKVYDNHLTDQEFQAKQGMRSVAKEWVGNIVKPRWDESKRQLRGVLKLVDESLATKLKNAYKEGILGTIGLSIDTFPKSRGTWHEGQPMVLIEGFKKIMSVDVVTEPAAGGTFNRLLASHLIYREENEMKKRMKLTPEFEQFLESLVAEAIDEVMQEQEIPEEEEEEEELLGEQEIPEEDEELPLEDEELQAAVRAVTGAVQDVATGLDEEDEELPEEEFEALFEQVVDPEEGLVEDPEKEEGNLAESVMLHGLADVAYRVDLMESEKVLAKRLTESRLPKTLQNLLRQQYGSRVFEERELMRSIKETKKAFASFDPTGQVSGLGGGRISLGMSPKDIQEIEFMRLVAGSNDFRRLESNEAHFVQERLTETAFGEWVKAGRPYYGTRRISEWVYEILGGNPLIDQRASEAITTSGMSSIVKNALNVLLAASYSKRTRWWEPIVRQEEVDTIDDATLVRTYGMDNLDVVNEGGPYTELDWEDEEETAAFVKRGNYAGITIETLLRDKLNEVRRIPDRLATSWYNTISALVSGVFTVNTLAGPQLGTGGALFNATAVTNSGGHANLLTTALSISAYDAAYTAMQKQTDQTLGTGSRLLIEPKYLLVPTDLRSNAMQIRNSELIPGSPNNDINPHYQGFEVIVVPTWSDVADWALVADPNEWPAIWLIFLRGRTVPELFTADSETIGAMFTNDVLRYKVRMLTWRFSSTYDCAPVADFRPLHKSNV